MGIALTVLLGIHVSTLDSVEEVFWLHTMAALAVAYGLLSGSPTSVGAGVMWLAVGIPLFLLEVQSGTEPVWSAWMLLGCALLFGLYGVFHTGMPLRCWWKALIGVIILVALSRFVTSEFANVNHAWRVGGGLHAVFGWHAAWLATLFVTAAALFFGIQQLFRKLTTPSTRAGRV